ncbi:MAG: deaminase [Candidatus Reconcilbacillus cellulovorans]|uniref:Deaminase n=1 Tax=Candidatus Reconcilbacillus cellulovorans TaxID=1906605 RepID=A0A2A6E2Q3_9BACL|nr:MAG: deaminase [Candidatus Reconcilbacillus cellulovorans]
MTEERAQIETVSTDKAPAAVGPYSQAVRAGPFVFASGQIPLTPDGRLVEGGIEEQTRQVMENLSAVLKAAGTSLDRVVKTTVFLKDLSLFAAFNEVYASYFPDRKPARSTVEVARLPRDVLVEIEAVAVV